MTASPLVEGGGNSLEVTGVGDGIPTERLLASYNNNESYIHCGNDPTLGGKETYASCGSAVFTDAVTGNKAPDIDESTDIEFDSCNKIVGGSHEIGWYSSGEETKSGGWIGGADQRTPPTSAGACAGIWTVSYSYTQTFTNGGKLTAESTGTFIVNLSAGATEEELNSTENPANPNYVQACAGKPVNCGTGNETVSQTDLKVAGRGVPLAFSRSYNSKVAVSQSTHGLLGYGWTPSFSDYLAISISEGKSTVTVVQDNGSTAKFTGNGTPGPLTGTKWGQARLVLNEDGTYTYTLPTQESSRFDSNGRLLSKADRNGNTTIVNRNAEGRLESITDAAGRKMTFAYNAEGMIESVIDPMGHTVKYAYEGGELATVTLPGETKTRWQFKYDTSHRMIGMTDGRGGTTKTEYDGSNRVISQTDPAERTLTFEYSTTGETQLPETKITNHATGAATQENFSFGYEPTSITHGFGTSKATTEKFSYNQAGSLTEVTDGNGHVTKYGYDSEGNRTSTLNPEKNETRWTYDTTHDVITTTTPKGETTTTKRDSKGNPEVVERPAPGSLTQVTRYKYNSLGELESMTDALERATKYEYGNQGDRTGEVDPEGNKRTWEYNEDSQGVATVSPRGNVAGGEPVKYTTRTERDPQGRAIKVTDPLGHETKYAYDGDGNLEAFTDALGHTTKNTYDANNELTKIEQPSGAAVETSYDGAGQMISQTDGNKHTTKYVRNVLEQVTEVIDPLLHKTTKEYDLAGNLTKVTDPLGRVSTRTYDAANRLKEIVCTSGRTETRVQYEYDADANRTKMVDPTGTNTLTYDQLDRPTESKDGHGDTSKYEYDLANELTKITYPNGKTVARSFDKDGRLQKVTDWLEHTTTFGYDPNSNLTSATWPNGTNGEDKYTYNEADQITETKMVKGAEALVSLVYTPDVDGQVKAVTSKGLPGEEATSYEYDPNNRLTKGAGLTYEYDAANNPTKTGPSTNTFNADDQLEKGTNATYAYDQGGERTKTAPSFGPATTYTYNLAGNLASVELAKEGKKAGFTDTYTYDGNNLRASQTVTGVQSFFAWQMTESLPLLLSDGTNSYIYGPNDLPIEQISSGGTVTYLHHDEQGSTRLLTGSTGTVTGGTTFDAYGNKTGSTGTATTPLGYDGQYTSSDTGLIYLRARVYDPATAQFLTADPVEPITRAPYSYATDNPLNYSDPSGLSVLGTLESAGEAVVHAGLDVAALPPYAVYYGSYELAHGINSLGKEFGLPGEVVSHLAALPLTVLEALGLSGDALIDLIKSQTVNNESICDEGKVGYINPLHGYVPEPLKGPEAYLPGIHENGEIDFEW
jgi:RHS repeat-associated protein